MNVCFAGGSVGPSVDVTTADSNGMFDNSILVDMQNMMRKVYKALSMLFMMGHGLMCYAIKVAYICIGVDPYICIAKLPNLNFLISGLVIYITAVFMCMSIGMYFVDISFKLGFAVIFIPVSIGLWPFKPTHGKFSENLSIVIRNGMLFMLVAIGVSYAVILIVDGIFASTAGEATGWAGFWMAIAEKKTALLVKNFSLDSLHILLVGFCLIFGFKILASSVNDYLNYFFQDSAFGSESPMHHVGTQAVGMAANYTVKPAVSFAKDVATHQAGRAIAGLGSGIAKMGSAEGRAQLKAGAKNTFNSARLVMAKGVQHAAHPVDTYNQVMAATGKVANKGIQKLGNAAKSVADTAFILTPIPSIPIGIKRNGKKFTIVKKDSNFSQNRANFNAAVGGWIDKASQKAGNFTETVLAHGGGKLLNAVAPKDKRDQFVEKTKQKIASGGAAVINGMNQMSAPTGTIPVQPTGPAQRVTADEVRQSLHQMNTKIKGAAQAFQDKADSKVDEYKVKAETSNQKYEMATENFNNAANAAKASGGATYDENGNVQSKGVIDSVASAAFDVAQEPARVAALVLKPAARLVIGTAGAITGHDTGVAKGIIGDFKQFANTSATFRAIKAIPDLPNKIMTPVVNGLGKVADKHDQLEQERAQKGENATKFYIKKTGTAAGKVLARGTKGTAEGSAKIIGNLLQGFGQALGDNKRQQPQKPKGLMARMRQKTAMEEYYEQQHQEEIEKAERAAYWQNLADKYDDQ
ncbi:MAG: hypothetical protein J6N49_07180 [Alphaproteobacteria bacterium]|nr:hypothetical protein [Alphaproteobacteria bacterium]